jgi:hypothetical protein
MKHKLALIALLIAVTAFAKEDGGRTGNGFAVPCTADAVENLREGFYSLDYLSTVGLGASRQVKTWEESAERIKRLLAGVLSEKEMKLYEDFVDNVRNVNDYGKNRIWESAPYGVINLKTQFAVDAADPGPIAKEQIKSNLRSLVTKLPKACQTGNDDADLIPAVVFQDHFFTGRPEGSLVYKFVPKVLNELEANNPLQLSYLYIHEWLWDISNSEDRNRRINHLLHSERIESMSTSEIRRQLTGMGLVLAAPGEASPKLGSADVVEAYEYTKIPTSRLTFKQVTAQLLKGQQAVGLGRYHLFALYRTCTSAVDCTAWRKSTPVWKDLAKTPAVPPDGEIWLRNEANLLILAKSSPVTTGQGPKQKVATECAVDHSDSQPYSALCRKMWAPEASLQPTGWIFAEDIAPDFQAYFTKDFLWIGGHAKRGDTEVRIALVAPYDQKTFLSGPVRIDPAPRTEQGESLEPGDYRLPNGRLRRVIEIQKYQLPDSGRVSSRKEFHYETEMDWRGTLRGMKAYAVYQKGTMDNISMKIDPPNSGGESWNGVDAESGGDCGPPRANPGTCFMTLQPAYVAHEASGIWKFDFAFTPLSPKTPAQMLSLKIVFEIDGKS